MERIRNALYGAGHMKFLSLFSGIEAASVAWKPLGWECVAVSEIEPFPCAVLTNHYPDTPNLGDVTKITEDDIKSLGHIDIIVFGSPCQDLSVAGKRKGFTCGATGNTTRSGLFFSAIQIVDWARKHCGCRYALWENVYGAFSSNQGRDFAAVVEHMAGLEDVAVPPKGWGNEGAAAGRKGLLEWATLDAQWFGVAQRRRRVFALADFGNWISRQPILLEPESLRGNSAPSRKTRQGITCSPEGIAGNVSSKWSKGTGGPAGDEHYNLITHALRGEGFDASEDGTGRGTPLVPVAVDFRNGALTGDVAQTLQAHHKSNSLNAEPAVLMPAVEPITLAIRGHGDSHNLEYRQDGTANALLTPNGGRAGIGVGAIAFHHNAQACQLPGVGRDTSISDSLTCSQQAAVSYGIRSANTSSNGWGIQQEMIHTLDQAQPHAVAVPDTLYNKGFNHINEANNASASQTHTRTLLFRVRQEIGEKAFAEWGLGILDSLQSPEILRSVLHGKELRQAAFSRRWVVCCALGSPFSCAEGAMFSLREASGEGCPPQRREPLEQLCGELGAYLSQLSQPGAQAERFLFDLWQASEGLGVLRQTLSAVQEVRRSAHGQRQPVQPFEKGNRVKPDKDMLGARMPRQIPRERLLREACATGEEGYAGPTTVEQERCVESGLGETPFAVRRLVVEECEFLQGFPRSYTNIPWRGKPESPDGPRYRALGNSMAVPCMAWIGQRIAAVSALYEAAA